MKLVLIRHAQSIRNAIFRGNHFYENDQQKLETPNHLLPITEKGQEQAEEIANKLYVTRGLGQPKYIFHSGFLRALQTAKIIQSEIEADFRGDDVVHDIPLVQNHLLRERDAGYTFEMNTTEAKKSFPFLDHHWNFEGRWFAVPPGGESFAQVMDRVALFLQQISTDHNLQDETIYAVTHGGTMQAFQMVIEHIPFDKADERVERPKNCGVLVYSFKKWTWERVFGV